MSRSGFGLGGLLLAGALGITALPGAGHAADTVLGGTIKSATGEKMGGVTVSARADGSTITTSVYTDEQGNYYFPPMPAGKYHVWAQALGFDYTDGNVDLSAAKRQDFTLAALADPEAKIRQLPGDVLLQALPASTDSDRKMVQVVRAVCAACHTPSFILQNRFDKDGWNAIISTMALTDTYGTYNPNAKPAQDIMDNQAELAEYLTRIRGPGPSELNVTLPPRPTGEAARIVVQDYRVQLDPELELPAEFTANDGYNWTMGTPSAIVAGMRNHDAQLDFDGNIWYTISTLNRQGTLGRIDAKTGENKVFKLPGANGYAAAAHGLTRDPSGNLWFGPTVGTGALAKIDPKTEHITVYNPPNPTGMSITLDSDKSGNIWMSASPSAGVDRFDVATEKFQFFTIGAQNGRGSSAGTSYGIAADANGNGWWSMWPIDMVGKGDVGTGQATNIAKVWQPPAVRGVSNETLGLRRMGADKNGDSVWVADSYAPLVTKIDVNTNQVTQIPTPYGIQPYHAVVDNNHNVWMNSWMADSFLKYDPATKTWTKFDAPTRGSEYRYMSILELPGQPTKLVLSSFRNHQDSVVVVRSQSEIDALKSQVPPAP